MRPQMYALERQEIAAFSQCFVECSVTPSYHEQLFNITEERQELFTEKGILIARSVIDLRKPKQYLLVANTTKETVVVEAYELLASLSLLSDEEISEPVVLESDKIKTIDISTGRKNIIQQFQKMIPSLDVYFDPFNDEEVCTIATAIGKYADIFETNSNEYGKAKNVTHRIDTGSSKPFNQPPHRASPVERETIRIMTEEMISNKVIQPSVSPWASPVVLVNKKNGKKRFCIDFRKLNLVTTRDVYPIPRIEDCLAALGGNVFFSSFDLLSGFWQIPMHEEDKKKTAFVVEGGLYEFTVMPFGLTNATATFQRYMDMVLASLKWNSLLVFLDDICVFSKSLREHLVRIEATLERFRAFGLKLNPEKCRILQQEFTYLGHAISEEGIKPDNQRKSKPCWQCLHLKTQNNYAPFWDFAITIGSLSKIIVSCVVRCMKLCQKNLYGQ